METIQDSANQLIQVTQLPVITERLRAVREAIEERTREATSLVCTPETMSMVKATRADLNKQFNELEALRKQVKTAVMGPYNDFESLYRECVTGPFKAADASLRDKINEVEGELKGACEAQIRSYFNECRIAAGLDFVTFEQTGITIDMASAKQKTPKKLMEAVRGFINRVSGEVMVINGMDDRDELMVHYKETLDLPGSISAVFERKRRMEQERLSRVAREEAEKANAEAEKKVDEAIEAFDTASLAPPTASVTESENKQEETVKLFTATFTVTGTLEQLKELKNYLKEKGMTFTNG